MQEYTTFYSESEFSSNIHNIKNDWVSYPVAESFEAYNKIQVQHQLTTLCCCKREKCTRKYKQSYHLQTDDVILLLFLALVRSQLKCFVPFWALYLKKDVYQLKEKAPGPRAGMNAVPREAGQDHQGHWCSQGCRTWKGWSSSRVSSWQDGRMGTDISDPALGQKKRPGDLQACLLCFGISSLMPEI